MLGIFAKVPGDEPVKTRLQPWLSAEQTELLYVACVADTLETACQASPNPVVFVAGGTGSRRRLMQRLLESGLPRRILDRLQWARQHGDDLGARLENAFESMRGLSVEPAASLILGSDSPSLEAGQVLHGLDLLGTVDLVLGPAHDGGYYAIGLRRPQPGLLNGIPWSSSRTLAATLEKARHAGLQVATLEPWTDVDRPEDLQVLTEQIARMRAGGDASTATHSESALRDLGLLDGDLNWTGRF